jgi:leucyl-tRNA synthetase
MNKKKAYHHREIEKKWQEKWEKKGLYTPDIKRAKKPFYNLWMFPYPSAEGLHAGHAFASTGSDIFGRFMRMHGKDVFQPIGYDSFGIHSENYALKIKEHPQDMLKRTTKNYERQMRALGHGYDWTRTVTTSDADYYRWTQWLFIKMFKAGLAYRAKAPVNWCPSCKTVLADEQVISGLCERCQAEVVVKKLEQWFFKITAYADRLLENLEKIDWPEKIKRAQRNWIGKSEGMMIKFQNPKSKLQIEVFTTRPDTLNAVTFLATSKLYERGSKEKIGKFSGKYAIDPLSGRQLPIWDTNYVAPDYGTGIIMGVPAHDERDMEFAKKYDIDIVDKKPDKKLWQLIEEKGWGKRHTNYHLRDWLISRQRYWGPPIPMIYCQKCGWQPVPEEELPVKLPYLKDYRPKGGERGPLSDHPEFYETKCPKCKGKARRETDVSDTFLDSSWYFLRYPSVGSSENSDNSDNLTESSEYSGSLPWDPEITKKWLPVDLYFGGAEHSVLHLMYARFVTQVLYDLKYLPFEEPFPWFFAHGLMIKDGAKMSKSRGNVVNPDSYIEKFGSDAFRLYLMFIGPMDGSPDFRDTGMEGMRKFVERVWDLFVSCSGSAHSTARRAADAMTNDASLTAANKELKIKMHQTIKKVTEDIQNFHYNTAIASIMEFVNLLRDKAGQSRGEARFSSRTDVARKSRSAALLSQNNIHCAEWDEALRNLALLLAPFAPHLTEEVWVNVLNQDFSIHQASWPKYDPELVKEDKATIAIQVNGRLRSTLHLSHQSSAIKHRVVELAKKDSKIQKWLKNKKIKKTIFVPGRLLNFVING